MITIETACQFSLFFKPKILAEPADLVWGFIVSVLVAGSDLDGSLVSSFLSKYLNVGLHTADNLPSRCQARIHLTF